MRLDDPAIPGVPYRTGGSWFSRASRSSVPAWLISIGLHAAIFLAFYHAVFREAPAPRRLIIPEARLVSGDGGGGPASASLAQLSLSPQPAAAAATPATPIANDIPAASALTGAVEVSTIATEGGTGFAIPTESLTAAAGEAIGTGLGNGGGTGSGKSAGGSGRGGVGPVSSFFGQTGNAYRVVYVVDVSASLSYYLDDILEEMRKSIVDLLPTQRFHIIISKNNQVLEFEPRRLVPANARYKAEAQAFLNSIRGGGKADPIAAMRRAFAVEPELIYFLSDGDYEDVKDDLARELGRLNPDKQVHITTLGFDPSPKPAALLEQIAATHGGNFRVVKPK